jgi:hypothetical protein
MKSKRSLSLALTFTITLAMIFGLFAAIPLTASAADAAAVLSQIFHFNHGGTGTLSAEISGDTVTVNGGINGATEQLLLDIDSGVTVIWKASYSGTHDQRLIYATGGGIFEVAEGGSVTNNGTGNAVYASGTSFTVSVRGGTVTSTSGITIETSGKVNMSGGTVHSDSNTAIYADGDIVIDGGVARSAGSNPTIHAKGGNVKVSGNGTVSAGIGYCIRAEGTNAGVTLNGGALTTDFGVGIGVIGVGSKVILNGGEVRTSEGIAIGAYGDDCTVEINAGSVSAISDTTTGIAVAVMGKNTDVKISGGMVSAKHPAAVAVAGEGSKVTVNGGFVFAYGTAIVGEGNVINMTNGSTPDVCGNAVVCAWNKVAPAYSEGSSDDLIISPSGAAAVWTINGYQKGIRYTNDVNTGFFAVDGITINADIAANTMSNFALINSYTRGQFTDVNEAAWYGSDQQKVVARAYEYGLMEGNSATTFNPAGNITIAEAITVAARVHSIYATGRAVTSAMMSNPWYKPFVDYAVDNGIIASDDFTEYQKIATRAEMAYIFAHALPDSEYGYRWNTKTPPDVTSSTPYVSEIRKLYTSGIVGGSDDLGTFFPANNITRAEAAAILARLIKAVPRLGSDAMPS